MKIDLFLGTMSPELLNTTKHNDVEEMRNLARLYFADKNYSVDVEHYTIGMMCVSRDFVSFFPPHNPKYYKDKIFSAKKRIYITDEPLRWRKQLNCELHLDFDKFYNSSKQEGYNMIARTVLDYLENLKYPVAIRKSFDKERFNSDMREFFRSIGCDV